MDTRTSEKEAAPRGPLAALAASADPGRWGLAAQISICGIFVIVFIAALELGRPVLLPFTFAVVAGLMLGPLSARADRAGMPPILTAILLWLLVIIICNGVIMLLSAPVLDWLGQAPEIGRVLKERLHFLDRPWSALQDLRGAISPGDKDKGAGIDVMSFIAPIFSFTAPALGQSIIFFGTLFFVLLGRSRLRRALIVGFKDHDTRLRTLKIWNDVESQLTSYLSVVAVINLVVGIAAAVITYFVGLPNALAWGVLAMILNFIPYLGALIMEAILIAVGLVTFPTLTQALLAPALYLAFTTLEGHFITPGIMGRRLTLSPLIVFLSLVFWTWLWGPAGAFLAVPLLITALCTINHLFPKQQPVLPG